MRFRSRAVAPSASKAGSFTVSIASKRNSSVSTASWMAAFRPGGADGGGIVAAHLIIDDDRHDNGCQVQEEDG
jgi:hypothetical protein